VRDAAAGHKPLVLRAGGTKDFYGRVCCGEILAIRHISGVISYEPTELVITARAGTSLAEIEQTLAGEGQMLAFEPPYFGEAATLGGAVACGLSGPRRPYTGSVRDFILGVKCLTGRGEILTFGGQVMKNVAGYDVARLMTGALGTLGVLLEVSLKVLPRPEFEISLARNTDAATALGDMNAWAGQPLPLSAACYEGGCLRVRLSGKEVAVRAARERLRMEEDPEGLAVWQRLREHEHDFFRRDGGALWRLSLPSTTPMPALAGDWLIDWGGAQRWLITAEPVEKIRREASACGGHAMLFRGGDRTGDVFHPLSPVLLALHRRLKEAFDPMHVLNIGRMYREF